METAKKNYKKLKYSGNENGWFEPIVTLGVTVITEAQAEELNSQFRNTGVKYEETSETPADYRETTTDQADHGEQYLVVKGGKQVVTNNKQADKKKEVAKETAKGAKATKGAPDAKPGDKTAFVKSDGDIKQAEHKGELNPEIIEGAPNNPA